MTCMSGESPQGYSKSWGKPRAYCKQAKDLDLNLGLDLDLDLDLDLVQYLKEYLVDSLSIGPQS